MNNDRAAPPASGQAPPAVSGGGAAEKRPRIAFAMTSNYLPESTGGLELGGGVIAVRREGVGHDVAAANYLNALIPLLPPELRR